MTAPAAQGNTKYRFDMEQVRHWYEVDGESVRAIARRLGVGDRTAWVHMNRAGVKMRPPGSNPPPSKQRPVSPLEEQAIRQACEESELSGARLIDIAERFGRADTTIRRIIRRPYRDRQPARMARPSAPRIAEGKVREAHAAGLRGRQIDRLYGWKHSRASVIQRRLGLDPNPPVPSPEELRALHDRLGTVMAVAAQIGRDKAYTSRLLKDAGVRISRGPQRPHPLDAHKDAIWQARIGPEKMMVPQLAARYGVSVGTMRGYLNHRGIATFRIVTAAEHEEIVRLHAEGLSNAEIGRRLGRPSITIRKHLQPGPRPRLR